MTRAKAKAAPVSAEPIEVVYGYGLRTWGGDGSSSYGFVWDLTAGSRTTAPDWKATAECGNGLHANQFGVGDWSLMGDLSEVMNGSRVLGVVRYDSALAIDLDGKIKAPWMEIVVTTKTASLGSVLGWIAPHRLSHIQGLTKVQAKAAATTGYSSAAATTGYRSAAATTGKQSIAAALGKNGTAKASATGAIVLAAHGDWDGRGYPLLNVFAGMVGRTYGGVTIMPDVAYRLGADGVPVEAV